MKALLLLLLIVSCGKNQMPAEKDLNDSDGDQIINEEEKSGMNKYIASVTPLKEIQMEVEFLLGESDLVKHKRTFSNKIDLQKYSKDLMVRSLAAIKSTDYFSEFSYMRVSDKKLNALVTGSLVAVKVRPTKTEVSPKALMLVTRDQKVELAKWSDLMEFELTSEQLNSVLAGESFLVATHLNEKKAFYSQSPEESIQEKTYRVLVNDGVETKIHYISKDLPVSDILKYFNISSYKDISEQSLLSTTFRPAKTEWWVRQINKRDIIILKDDLRSLADHYLEGFQKTTIKYVRENGKVVAPLNFKKHAAAKVLFKIRGERKTVTFAESTERKSGNVGGRDNRDSWSCDYHYRTASPVQAQMVDEVFMWRNLGLESKVAIQDTLKAADDEKGRFLEIQVESEAEEFDLTLNNVSSDQYVQEGLYFSKCNGANEPKIKPNLQVPERSLSLSIEAYVEKI